MTEQTRDILFTGASLLGGEPTDIALSGGTIIAIGADARNAVRDPRVVDAEGLIALPGLVDIHTHLRQPGGEAGQGDQALGVDNAGVSYCVAGLGTDGDDDTS